MNFTKPEGFLLEKGLNGRELMAVHCWSTLNSVKVRYGDISYPLPEDWIPVGSVNFVEHWLENKVKIDYYPDFAKPILGRKVWQTYVVPFEKCFIKPYHFKDFTGFVKEEGANVPLSPSYFCSEIVEFVNEFRLYVSDGEVLDSGWYDGQDEEKKVPKINLDLTGVFGALDIGETKEGKTLLVEFQPPYSIGWYGKNQSKYVEFLVRGWNFLNPLDKKPKL